MTSVRSRRRSTTYLWGGLAEVWLAAVLIVWVVDPGIAGRTLFGGPGAVIAVVATMLATAVGIVFVSVRPHTSAALRWGLALPIAIIAASVAVLGLGAVFAPSGMVDVGLGILLIAGVIGADIVGAQVARNDETIHAGSSQVRSGQ
jgi:hypothetical protein